jgi:large subunit ribosomal protein L22
MLITAEQKNTRQSSRKVRLVANAVKKLTLAQAIDQLAVMERRASLVVLKTIKQAVANAVKQHQIDVNDLQLADIQVSDGQIYKRMRAVARGRGHRIEKRSCHVRVVLSSRAEVKPSGEQEINKEVKVKSKV